jgi:AraC family transcriptional regulator
MPPARYRKEGSHTVFQQATTTRSEHMYPVEIRHLPAMQTVTVDHQGDYMEIGKAFETLYGCLGMRQLFQPDMRMVGIYLDDPTVTPQAELRSKAGVIHSSPLAEGASQAPLSPSTIHSGDYAVLKYRGPYANMREAYQWLYGQWLPASGRDAADAPVFEEYLNNPRTTAPADLLTEICLPLRPA